jgi:hypothetical protein
MSQWGCGFNGGVPYLTAEVRATSLTAIGFGPDCGRAEKLGNVPVPEFYPEFCPRVPVGPTANSVLRG